jgi:hypothetical protein
MNSIDTADKKRFTRLVEHYVQRDRCSYMDAMLKIAEDKMLEFDDMAKYVTPSIRDKIQAEATQRLMMRGGNQLPV